MEKNVTIAWLLAMWLVIIFVAFRIVIPGLVNSQNDGALILVPVLAMVVGTAAYATYVKVFTEEEE